MSNWNHQLRDGWELRLYFGEKVSTGFSRLSLSGNVAIEVKTKGQLHHEGNRVQIRVLDRKDLDVELTVKQDNVVQGHIFFLAEEFVDNGNLMRPIVKDDVIIGKLEVGYLIYDSFKHEDDTPLDINLHNVIIGHRGFGATNRNIMKNSAVVENTLDSFLCAEVQKTDFVEFDVQLTLDNVPVIYHDLWMQIKTTDFLGNPQVLRVPINKLRYDQIKKLKPIVLDHIYYEKRAKQLKEEVSIKVMKQRSFDEFDMETRRKYEDEIEKAVAQLLAEEKKTTIYEYKTLDKDDSIEMSKQHTVGTPHSVIPRFSDLLTKIPDHVGFDIEIKYINCDLEGKMLGYMERNEYINRILEVVFKYGKNRKMFFSSFDADVITLLRKKQQKYPVLLLTTGTIEKYVTDSRRHSLVNAINFAERQKLTGVVSDSIAVMKEPHLVDLAHQKGLILLTYGAENDVMDASKKEYEYGVDSLCTNRVVEIGLKITNKK
ncbi:hypothetical protein EIN_227730 [Entamoeba invadens IP1]|uniref:GP-PDE domain-containing protein n=1 Tax=Entamoeba invadens IP1 TaxID=370355 RepID=A0A0A1U638_ENTIV|nr:hypothetical protein EIN_227730 [Entamoeba invadens IP1]ELP88350.1 hypothetical protein EIN_227730 [Entamoeba invadens IP1]|eukprot:XP_004255121.1 hypothetical protein EIN_227730 [Entamoeba invadens IP1]